MTDDTVATVKRGPSIDHDPVRRGENQLTASLRVLTSYNIRTDQINAQLDVLINNAPVGAGLRIGNGGDQFAAAMVCGSSDLPLPKSGVIDAIGIKAYPGDLISMLRGLADALDEAWKR